MADLARIGQMLATAFVAGLLLALEHLVVKFFGRDQLHRTVRYMMGILALYLPFSVLLMIWSDWWALAALWMVTVMGGLVVVGFYGIGYIWIEWWRHVEEKEREALDEQTRKKNG